MSSACPLLLLMIYGCWTLPLPSTMTVVWSVLDNGLNQVNLVCLVNSRPDAIFTVWISNVNETNKRTLDGIQMNIMPASSTQQYIYSSGNDQPPVFVVPSPGGPSSFFSTRNAGFQLSISLSIKRLPIIAPFTSLNMPLHSAVPSLSSSKEVRNFVPSPFRESGLIVTPELTESNNAGSLTSDSQQDLNIHIGQPVLTGNLQNFAHLSLPIDSLKLWDSAASCFLAQAESVDINDIILSGRSSRSLCYDEDFSTALALRVKQDFLFVLAIRIIVFKLLIIDLLVTWIAVLQLYWPVVTGL
ncbi:uncharacterized protein [Aquarana catesbeiana]|uniref:uncharacterized protein n=1 Tax=Aquarana catesbeiana TaxID=8400 RepID=UPI003CC963B2